MLVRNYGYLSEAGEGRFYESIRKKVQIVVLHASNLVSLTCLRVAMQ